MIEIGSGMSTLLAAEAIQNETEGNPCRLIAIELHPKEFLRRGWVSNKLKAAFASYDPDTAWPGSFWMRRAPDTLKDF